MVVAQRDASVDAPGASDLYTIGTRAVIRKVGAARTDQMEVLVLGMERVVIVKVDDEDGHMTARVRALPLPDDSSRETEALTLSIVEMGSKFVGLMQIAATRRRRNWRACSPRRRTRCGWRT